MTGHTRSRSRNRFGGLTPLQRALNSASLYLPFNGTLAAIRGTSPTFTRATPATVTDHEGIVRTVKSGEARFPSYRREENLWGASSSTLASGSNLSITLAAGTYAFSMGTGTGTATFSGTGGATGTLTASTTNRKQALLTITAGTLVVTASVAALADLMVNNLTGRAIQVAPEYVSVGVAIAPLYHGANVDGVKYFGTANGNTVDGSGVVTEATGAVLPNLQGVLSEPTKTNILTNSSDITAASWLKAALTATGNVAIAPSGVLEADSLVEDTATTNRYLQAATMTAAQWTISIYAKNLSGNRFLQLRPIGVGFGIAFASFNLVDGTVAATGGTQFNTAKIEALPNGWYRCQMTATYTGAPGFSYAVSNAAATEIPVYAGDGTSGFLVWGAQANLGAEATTYIPTTTAAVTRNADVESPPATGLITPPAFSAAIEVNIAALQNEWLWCVNIDAGNFYGVIRRIAGDFVFRKTVAGVMTDSLAFTAGIGTHKVAVSAGALGMLISHNGIAGTSASYAVPVASGGTLYIGGSSAAGSMLLAKNKDFRVWQSQLTQDQLNLLTA